MTTNLMLSIVEALDNLQGELDKLSDTVTFNPDQFLRGDHRAGLSVSYSKLMKALNPTHISEEENKAILEQLAIFQHAVKTDITRAEAKKELEVK